MLHQFQHNLPILQRCCSVVQQCSRSKRWWPQHTPTTNRYNHTTTTTINQSEQSISPKSDQSALCTSTNELSIPNNLDYNAAAPVYTQLPDYKPNYALIKGDGGELRANFSLYCAAIEKSEVAPKTYDGMTGDERDIYFAHLTAIQNRQLSYKDPTTGYNVMAVTQLLVNGECCGNGCRHCPYDWVNVEEQKRERRIWNGAFFV